MTRSISWAVKAEPPHPISYADGLDLLEVERSGLEALGMFNLGSRADKRRLGNVHVRRTHAFVRQQRRFLVSRKHRFFLSLSWRRGFSGDVFKAIGCVELCYHDLALPPALDCFRQNSEGGGMLAEQEGGHGSRIVVRRSSLRHTNPQKVSHRTSERLTSAKAPIRSKSGRQLKERLFG